MTRAAASVLTTDAWVQARDLQPGDIVLAVANEARVSPAYVGQSRHQVVGYEVAAVYRREDGRHLPTVTALCVYEQGEFKPWVRGEWVHRMFWEEIVTRTMREDAWLLIEDADD